MAGIQQYHIRSVTDYHRVLGLPKPKHPLVSVINVGAFTPAVADQPISIIFDFYCISLKRDLAVSIKYGQQACDFDEGVLFFMAPGQVWSMQSYEEPADTRNPSGWMILMHPDFLWNTALAKSIKQYEYFKYSVYEALYLSDKEETMVTAIAGYIEQECDAHVDKLSQSVIISQLELLLTYAERFYQRQFVTRKVSSHQLISRVEDILAGYFDSEELCERGMPTVAHIAGQLNVSPGYLSEMLKALTGQNTQQMIHGKLIEKAKERLCTTNLSVSEIAYELGFEHIQSFSKIFKAKTNLTPVAFRNSSNWQNDKQLT
jgi:AraC-like DNA-binding protein